MKKTTKILATLALSVGAISGLIAIPAWAETSSSSDVTVQVKVLASNPSATMIQPEDGDKLSNSNVDIKLMYSNTQSIEYSLIYTDKYGNDTSYSLPIKQLSTDSYINGDDVWVLNLKDYDGGKYGRYTIRAKVNGSSSTTDSVSFEYRAATTKDNGEVDPNTNNPKVDIHVDDGVDHVCIQIYDKDNKPMLDVVKCYTPDDDGNIDFTAPLDEVGAKEGDYTVVITPYDDEGNVVDDDIITRIHYKPLDTPEVPNTGGSIFAGLNFTRVDYIATGLSVFFLIVFFSVMIIRKSAKNNK